MQLLLEATAAGIHQTVDELVGEHLDHIMAAVTERWNGLFSDRPNLQLAPDGSISRPTAGGELGFEAFSAGEQAAAGLLLRLIAAATVSGTGFCWIDEPLEHLDPATRRLVAGTLATGPRVTGLRQVLVTTYEEDLARRLSETTANTRIVYVRPRSESAALRSPDVLSG